MFLDRFDIKNDFKKINKKYYFDVFPNKKHGKTIITTLLNTSTWAMSKFGHF
jgi:hypothetical protein